MRLRRRKKFWKFELALFAIKQLLVHKDACSLLAGYHSIAELKRHKAPVIEKCEYFRTTEGGRRHQDN